MSPLQRAAEEAVDRQYRRERPGFGYLLLVVFVCGYGLVGRIDMETEQLVEVHKAEVEKRRSNFAPVNDPTNPPRCPKINAAGEPLRYSVATKVDTDEWRHVCAYVES